jgi:hypothetical protein
MLKKRGYKRRLSVEKSVRKAERAWFLFSLFTARFWGIAVATIEDLAFDVRPSGEADEVSRPRCLSTRQEKEASHVMKKSIRRMS